MRKENVTSICLLNILDLTNRSMTNLNETNKRLYYEYLSKQIEREDGLVNTRMTWLLTSQGFLFAALALIAKKGDVREDLYSFLTIIFPVTGIVLSIVAFLGVHAANLALRDLKKHWNNFKDDEIFVRPFGNQTMKTFGDFPSTLLPILLFLIWVSILIFFLIN